MKIAIGCDHAGFPYKDGIVAMLQAQGHMVLDFGTNSADSVDYPDFGHKAATAILSGEAQTGVIICGSGIGISIVREIVSLNAGRLEFGRSALGGLLVRVSLPAGHTLH